MEKQTAVEWLGFEINRRGPKEDNPPQWLKELYNQAKEMEKQQIADAFGVGCQVESTRLIGYQGMAEQYYNETYGK